MAFFAALEILLPPQTVIVAEPPPWLKDALEAGLHRLLVGKHILYKWPKTQGDWALGEIVANNKDEKVTVGGEVCNYQVKYEKDKSKAVHYLSMKQYAKRANAKGGSWVLVDTLE